MTGNTKRLLSKVGVAVALGFGLVIASQTSALAAAHTVDVTPSTGLADGDTVTVSVAGATPSTTYFVSECGGADPAALACDLATASAYTTDESGAAEFPFTVHSTFEGVNPDQTPAGTVDCTAVTCYVASGNDASGWTATAISFG